MSPRPRLKDPTNPLVPIVGHRLRAAIRWKDIQVIDLATLAGEDFRTVDTLMRGKCSKTHAERRRNLAHALGCPDRWLGGKGFHNHSPPWSHPLSRHGPG